ncbi:MAG TPA: hypothetical protein VF250_15540 [Conexibacter sp.]
MPRARSRNALLLGTVAVALVCASPAAAARATLTTDARCYLQGAQLRMTASGLAPRAPLTVVLDGRELAYGGSAPSSDAAGSFSGSFATPALAGRSVQRRHLLVVSDGTRRPRARFTVTRPAGGDFQPSSGDPRTLRARFRVWDFGSGAAHAGVSVWLHWINPRGTVSRTALIGATGGDCGTLATRPRRVFPFAPAAGRWLLVLDTHRRYRVQASGPRAKIPVHVRPA